MCSIRSRHDVCNHQQEIAFPAVTEVLLCTARGNFGRMPIFSSSKRALGIERVESIVIEKKVDLDSRLCGR